MSLVVVSTHPIQYHAPVYRALQARWGIPVTAIYGSDFSVAGYHDREFGTTFAWDTDLLSGYASVFLSRVGEGGAVSPEAASAHGLRQALRRAAPRAVLLLGYRPRFHRQAFWWARREGCALLFRGETTDVSATRGRVKGWVRDRLLRWFYSRFDKLLYIGQRSLQHYRRLGCSGRQLEFSPYCVDAAVFQPEERDREGLRAPTRQGLGLSGQQRVLLFSGKLVPRKAPDLLLRAVQALPSLVRERVVVVFLGDGQMRESLPRLARTPPPVEVRFTGFQNQRSLSPYYHAADVLVLPSPAEPWGLVVNEALHHGVPCVVSSGAGCTPDLVEPGATGELFEAGSDSSLSLALQRALGLPGDNAGLRVRCRQKVAGYSVERAAEGIAAAYGAVGE